MNILTFRTQQGLRTFIYKNIVRRIPAVLVLMMSFPLQFRFGNQNSLGAQCPGVLHAGNIDTLSFGIHTAGLPTGPYHIQFTFILEYRTVDSPVVILVRTDTAFHYKLSIKRISVYILQYIHLVIVRIAIIGGIIDIPFAIDIMDFRCPKMVFIRRIGRNPDSLPGSILHIGNVCSLPEYQTILHGMHIVVSTFMEQSPGIRTFQEQRVHIRSCQRINLCQSVLFHFSIST